jgi:hypothetical protein
MADSVILPAACPSSQYRVVTTRIPSAAVVAGGVANTASVPANDVPTTPTPSLRAVPITP